MLLVFSDMDGCLLDHHSYEWRPALPALDELGRLNAPVILTTSKTLAEVRHWQRIIGLHSAAIVENGGAIDLPPGHLPHLPFDAEPAAEGHAQIVFGWPHARVVAALHHAAVQARAYVRGFSEMPVEEIAAHCDMAPDDAELAALRQYSEPFLLLTPNREPDLLRAFLANGLQMTRGGRFHHAQNHPGKGYAVRRLIDIYSVIHPEITTVGLGDGLNDEDFLRAVDYPIILKSKHSEELSRRLPDAAVTPEAGPKAWADALLTVLRTIAAPPSG